MYKEMHVKRFARRENMKKINLNILLFVSVIVFFLHVFGFFELFKNNENTLSIIQKHRIDKYDVTILKYMDEQYIIIENEKGLAITKR